MAAWSSGPSQSALVALVVVMLPIIAHSAPYTEQTTEMEIAYPVGDSTGCYYNFQHYDESDRILTNEPCLNCTCHNRMLMCYLRVCPFTKAIGQDCKVEKRADQCCPVITCPEVPVQLLHSTTPSTAVGHPDTYGCFIDNLFYSDGARVPSSPNKPCELCYCIRNKTACVMQECTLDIEGCKPVYQEGVCCPVRYDCDHPDYTALETTTTFRPTPALTFTTMTPGAIDCVYNEVLYADGALVKKDIPCEFCYCMKGDIMCAVQRCGPTPLEKANCTALPTREGQCCPDTYDCDNIIEGELTTNIYYPTTTESVISSEENLIPDEKTGHTPFDEIITTEMVKTGSEQPVEEVQTPIFDGGHQEEDFSTTEMPTEKPEEHLSSTETSLVTTEETDKSVQQLTKTPAPEKEYTKPEHFQTEKGTPEGAIAITEPTLPEKGTDQSEGAVTTEPEVTTTEKQKHDILTEKPTGVSTDTEKPEYTKKPESTSTEEQKPETEKPSVSTERRPEENEVTPETTETEVLITEPSSGVVTDSPHAPTMGKPESGSAVTEHPLEHATEGARIPGEDQVTESQKTEAPLGETSATETSSEIVNAKSTESSVQLPDKEQSKPTEQPEYISTQEPSISVTKLEHEGATETLPTEKSFTEEQEPIDEQMSTKHPGVSEGETTEHYVTKEPSVPTSPPHIPSEEYVTGSDVETTKYSATTKTEVEATKSPVTEAELTPFEGQTTESQIHFTKQPTVSETATDHLPSEEHTTEGKIPPTKESPASVTMPVTLSPLTDQPKTEHTPEIQVTEGEIQPTKQPIVSETATGPKEQEPEGETKPAVDGVTTSEQVTDTESKVTTALPSVTESTPAPTERPTTQTSHEEEKVTESDVGLPKEPVESSTKDEYAHTDAPVTEHISSTEYTSKSTPESGHVTEQTAEVDVHPTEYFVTPASESETKYPGHVTESEIKATEPEDKHSGTTESEVPTTEHPSVSETKIPSEHEQVTDNEIYPTEDTPAPITESQQPSEGHVTESGVTPTVHPGKPVTGTEEEHPLEQTEHPIAPGSEKPHTLVDGQVTEAGVTEEPSISETDVPLEGHVTESEVESTKRPSDTESETEHKAVEEHLTESITKRTDHSAVTELTTEHAVTEGAVTKGEIQSTKYPIISETEPLPTESQVTEAESHTTEPPKHKPEQEQTTRSDVTPTETPEEQTTKHDKLEHTEVPIVSETESGYTSTEAQVTESDQPLPELPSRIGEEHTTESKVKPTEEPLDSTVTAYKHPEEQSTEGQTKPTEKPFISETEGQPDQVTESEKGPTEQTDITVSKTEHIPSEPTTEVELVQIDKTDAPLSESTDKPSKEKPTEGEKQTEKPDISITVATYMPLDGEHSTEKEIESTSQPELPVPVTESGKDHTTKSDLKLTEQPEKPTSETEHVYHVENTTETKIHQTEQPEITTTETLHTSPDVEVTEGVGTERIPTDGKVTESHTQMPEKEHTGQVGETTTEGRIQTSDTEQPIAVTDIPHMKPDKETDEQKPTEKPADSVTQTPEEQFPTDLPGEHVVPGEGSCLVDGQTYSNNSHVPPINHCQLSCKCVSSILQCESVMCLPAPSNLKNCIPMYQTIDSCCPTYSCTMPEKPDIESGSHQMDKTTLEPLFPTEHPVTVSINVLPAETEKPTSPSESVTKSDKTPLSETKVPETTNEPFVTEKSTTVGEEIVTEKKYPEYEGTEAATEGVESVTNTFVVPSETTTIKSHKPSPPHETHTTESSQQTATPSESMTSEKESTTVLDHGVKITTELSDLTTQRGIIDKEPTTIEVVTEPVAITTEGLTEPSKSTSEGSLDKTEKPATEPAIIETTIEVELETSTSRKDEGKMTEKAELETTTEAVTEVQDKEFTSKPTDVVQTTSQPRKEEPSLVTVAEAVEAETEKQSEGTTASGLPEKETTTGIMTEKTETEQPTEPTEVEPGTTVKAEKHTDAVSEGTEGTTIQSGELPKITTEAGFTETSETPGSHVTLVETEKPLGPSDIVTEISTSEKAEPPLGQVTEGFEATSKVPELHVTESMAPEKEGGKFTTEEPEKPTESTVTEKEDGSAATEKEVVPSDTEKPYEAVTKLPVDHVTEGVPSETEASPNQTEHAVTDYVTELFTATGKPTKVEHITTEHVPIIITETEQPFEGVTETSSKTEKPETSTEKESSTEKQHEQSETPTAESTEAVEGATDKPIVSTEQPKDSFTDESTESGEVTTVKLLESSTETKTEHTPLIHVTEPVEPSVAVTEIPDKEKTDKPTELPEITTEYEQHTERVTRKPGDISTQESITEKEETLLTKITEETPSVTVMESFATKKPIVPSGTETEVSTTEIEETSQATEGKDIITSKPAEPEITTKKDSAVSESESTKGHEMFTGTTEPDQTEQTTHGSSHITEAIDYHTHKPASEAPELFTSGPIEEQSTISSSTSQEASTSEPLTTASEFSTFGPPTVPSEYPGISPEYPDMPDYPIVPSEPDYEDEDKNSFGPGTCRYGGKVYVSAQQIPRDDPCDFCFCFRSDIICLQQSCPPPIPRCHEEPIRGFCCPRYECPVSMGTSLNVSTTTSTTTTTLPPHFFSHAYKGKAIRHGCQIQGQVYEVGDMIRSASGPCLNCTCGGNGQMKCEPKACSPEPMLRKMIAEVASRRRR